MPISPLLCHPVMAEREVVATHSCRKQVPEQSLHMFCTEFQSQTPVRVHFVPFPQPIQQKWTTLTSVRHHRLHDRRTQLPQIQVVFEFAWFNAEFLEVIRETRSYFEMFSEDVHHVIHSGGFLASPRKEVFAPVTLTFGE